MLSHKKHIGSMAFKEILILLLFTPLVANAALVQLSSNSGEVRDFLQTDTNTLFAATQGGGIYKSTNSGATWARQSGLSEPYIWRLAGHSENPLLLYAATSKGLCKSSDGGLSWSQKTFDEVRAVAVDPSDQNHVLLGVRGAGIFASSDGGNSFSLSNSGLDSLDVTAIAFDPLHPGVVYTGLYGNLNGAWGGVFKSTTGGSSWTNWNNPGGNGAIGNKFVTALVVDDQGAIHAGTFNPNTNLGSLYKQTGTGGWSVGPEVCGVETLVVDKSTQRKLWAGTRAFGPWVSSNNGSTWTQRPVNPATAPDVYSAANSILTLPGSPVKVVVGVAGLGLYQTTDDGITWTPVGQGIKADRARAFVVYPPTNPTTWYMGLHRGGVMKSTDNGVSWFHLGQGMEVPGVEYNLTVSHLGISTTNPSTIYAATMGWGLFKWDGSRWNRVAESGLPNDLTTYWYLKPMGLLVDPADDRIVYYSLFDPGQGVYRRNATGVWTRVLSGAGASGAGASKVVMNQKTYTPSTPKRIYALMFGNLPYRSENDGATATWTEVSADDAGFEELSFFCMAENPLDNNRVVAATSKGLFQSGDGGKTWTGVDSISGLGTTALTGLVFSPQVNGRVWAVDRSGGYYCSNDHGTTWTALTDPLLGSPILDLQMIDGALYLVTDGSGLLKDPSPACP